MILADSPSRWASHYGRVQEMINDLPLPPLRINEIIRRLFCAPQEYEELHARAKAARSIQTTLGLPPPVMQGSFQEIGLDSGSLTAVLKLGSCAVCEPVAGNDFWELRNATNLSRISRVATSPHFR